MVILISISYSSQCTCVVWSLLFHRLLIYIATAPSCSLLAALNEKPPQALQRREIQQSCKTMLWDIFCLISRQITLQGMLCILLLACLTGILPASHIWGERGLVPTQNECAVHTRMNIFTEELYRHLSLVENWIFTVSFPDYSLPDSCVQKPQATCAPDWTKREISWSRNSSSASKHEDTLNWWEVPVTSFAVTRHPSCVFVTSPARAPWEVGPLKTGLTA